VPLAPLTTLRVGGRAQWFARARRAEDIAAAHRWARERGLPLFVLGGGSNLVVSDAGIRGLVLQIAITGIEVQPGTDATRVRAGAGEVWDSVVEAAVARGLAGVECLSGIPGTVGGTPIQNVGAYGQEVSQTLVEVETFDTQTGRAETLPGEACGFSYRGSRFKTVDGGRYVVSAVTFGLRPGPPTVTYPDVARWLAAEGLSAATVADVRRGVLAIRRSKGMVLDDHDPDTRSVGSFFVNPVLARGALDGLRAASAADVLPSYPQPDGRVKIPAAWLIEQVGFPKGSGCGPVGLSSKHPLAIVNRGGASAGDVVRLATAIARRVRERFGIRLRPEPVFAGFDSDPDVDALLRAED
jgi:UDP-N-acetylmuramate dehydrogenase